MSDYRALETAGGMCAAGEAELGRVVNRRTVLASIPVAMGGVARVLSGPALLAAGSDTTPPPQTVHAHFPSQDQALVREVVSVSHGNFQRVRELVDARPELAKAAWDWGFGDWETALGAASHTGNREIAIYLMQNGARADLFTAAMFGYLEIVRSSVEAMPGIQAVAGPHGISLLAHARSGGEPAAAVVRYLESVGGAEVDAATVPLELDAESYAGVYRFAGGPDGQLEIALRKSGHLTIRYGASSARTLLHRGGGDFHPIGAPSVLVHFERDGQQIVGLVTYDSELIVAARRVAGA